MADHRVVYDPQKFRVLFWETEDWISGSLLPVQTQIFLRGIEIASPVSPLEFYVIDHTKRLIEIRLRSQPKLPWRVAELTGWVTRGYTV